MDDEDDTPVLSGQTLAALQEFLSEQQQQQQRFDQLRQRAEQRFNDADENHDDDYDTVVSMELFNEDWQLSQFWYDEATSTTLAEEVIRNTNGRVVCISAPTAFVKLKSLKPANIHNIYLFEYDDRFKVFGTNFIHYDYNTPLSFAKSADLKGTADFIIVDPPFLSEDCATKTLETVRFLAAVKCKILMCTGAVMEDTVKKEIDVCLTTFHPKHKNGLSNEFRCYTNYKSDQLLWVDEKTL